VLYLAFVRLASAGFETISNINRTLCNCVALLLNNIGKNGTFKI
jgi:hypothetical protein